MASKKVLGLGSPVGQRSALPTTRAGQVLELLRDAILDGRFAPGERLKQDHLCEQFGLSPTTVREALRDLEREGLVRHTPNRGVVVSDITDDELFGVLIPVRLAIEGYALPRAATVMPTETATQLHEIVDRMGTEAEGGQLTVLNDLDLEFHEVAISASGSEQALQLWRAVLPRIRLQFRRLAPLHRDLREIQAEHRQLLAALETRDADTIVAALHEHIVASAEQLLGSSRSEM